MTALSLQLKDNHPVNVPMAIVTQWQYPSKKPNALSPHGGTNSICHPEEAPTLMLLRLKAR